MSSDVVNSGLVIGRFRLSARSAQQRAAAVITLVSALGAAQSVAIISQISGTGDTVGGSVFGAGPTAKIVLDLLSSVFLAVAITVTSVVVTGSAEVMLTGQVRDIALRRLLGSAASAEQSRANRAILRRAVTGMAWRTVAWPCGSPIGAWRPALCSIRIHGTGR